MVMLKSSFNLLSTSLEHKNIIDFLFFDIKSSSKLSQFGGVWFVFMNFKIAKSVNFFEEMWRLKALQIEEV